MKNEPLRGPVSETDARELIQSLQQVPDKNGYADFMPDPR
jgi:hypothetical protein